MKTVNIGGDRLGSGNKMNVTMHGYERSNHDKGNLWKSTLSAGTLVPFMVEVGLPGDTFDINLDALVRTNPTIGPLFGSFKVQLDVFQCPIRLYHQALHQNKLKQGMKMAEIKFPQLVLTGDNLDATSTIPLEFQHINQSSLLAYLGIRGLGNRDTVETYIQRNFNAIPYLAYWEIFKCYYANKQEDNAYYIHYVIPNITSTELNGTAITLPHTFALTDQITVYGTNLTPDNILFLCTGLGDIRLREFAAQPRDIKASENKIEIRRLNDKFVGKTVTSISEDIDVFNLSPKLTAFPLAAIDDMRDTILTKSKLTAMEINASSPYQYGGPLSIIESYRMASLMAQEGLAVKTYQSDIFNNWIRTEWIEGTGSIADITKVSTAGNVLYLDALNIAKKVYDMLNRVAISGGSYEDWVSAVYDHDSKWRAENPIYCGGLSKELVFQEVVSTAATDDEALGSLAGKGIMSSKHKGGHIIVNVDEPSYLMGIVSITPRIDYYQGNEWHTTALITMDDLHKPALDGIGFQDLITDQMAFWDTDFTSGVATYHSAGKQPAWLNYMTDYNKVFGNFADPRNQMFMTLARRYTPDTLNDDVLGIKDITTYIDPAMFNYAFADVSLDSMNFLTQISINKEVRRKMSAKIMPNL